MTLRVRRGAVDFASETGVLKAPAGTELVVASDGGVERGRVMPSGPEWDWVLRIAPVFGIEGASLGAYLDGVAYETGWTVVMPEPAALSSSSEIILHGSAAGMTPAESPAAVLPTCGFAYSVVDGQMTVVRTGGPTGSP